MFGFGKKKKTKQTIPVTDGNAEYTKRAQKADEEMEAAEKLREEGRKKFYELFNEIVQASTQEILTFYDNFTKPSEELVEFGKAATLKIIHADGDLNQYRRAQLFKERMDEYGQIVTASMIDKFRKQLNKFKLYLNDVHVTDRRMNITSEVAEKMLEVSKKIHFKDAPLYFLFDGYSRPSNHSVSDPEVIKLAHELFKCEYCIPEKPVEEFKTNLDHKKFYVPHQIQFGNFRALQEGKDPIILAELTKDMYVLVGHMPEIPKSHEFQV